MKSIILRIIKGALIGSGFIVPGISGGTLAMVFGIYERLIRFLGNIRENFKENVRYFIPVGIGAIIGVIFFSRIVSYLLGNFATMILWFFVGAIAGTLPSLWMEASKEGRGKKEIIITIITFVLAFLLLKYGSVLVQDNVQPSFVAWLVCGFLISLGVLIPGLSSSNFIVYMGLYKDMADGFANMDLSVVIPIAIGGITTVVLLIGLINRIYEKHYSEFFHFIIGVVIASTVMIIPTDYSGFALIDYLGCLVLFILGVALSVWMAKLEETAGEEDV